jgi:hypothetical protein
VLAVRLVSTPPNTFALGARVIMHVGARSMVNEVRSGGSLCSQNDLALHFGLGSAARAEKIEVRWPDGSAETITNVVANRRIVIRQGKGLESSELFVDSPRKLRPTGSTK